jgi:uncharacterized membrane protein
MNIEPEEQIFIDEMQYLEKLHKIVQETIQEKDLILNNLLHPSQDILSKEQRLSDKVAHFGGSWRFIVIFGVILMFWIIINVVVLKSSAFDPYPFILMNLILSCIAALQAPIIMMSQNRQEEKDRMRNENDYLINLKSEIVIRSLDQKMDLLLREQIKTLYDMQVEQIAMLKKITANIEKI